jgi:hypothetical protein
MVEAQDESAFADCIGFEDGLSEEDCVGLEQILVEHGFLEKYNNCCTIPYPLAKPGVVGITVAFETYKVLDPLLYEGGAWNGRPVAGADRIFGVDLQDAAGKILLSFKINGVDTNKIRLYDAQGNKKLFDERRKSRHVGMDYVVFDPNVKAADQAELLQILAEYGLVTLTPTGPESPSAWKNAQVVQIQVAGTEQSGDFSVTLVNQHKAMLASFVLQGTNATIDTEAITYPEPIMEGDTGGPIKKLIDSGVKFRKTCYTNLPAPLNPYGQLNYMRVVDR